MGFLLLSFFFLGVGKDVCMCWGGGGEGKWDEELGEEIEI